MTNYILLVFEGERTEPKVLESVKRHHLNDLENTLIYGCHCSDIYALYHKLEKDPDLDLFTVIKEHTKNPGLALIRRGQVSEIFLFFDFDGHATAAADEKLFEMLEYFNEETENGKLYISYPMVESLKHLNAPVQFKDLTVPCRVNIKYKSLVNDQTVDSYKDLSNLSGEDWKFLLSEHCKKMNYLVFDDFSFPSEYVGPMGVFRSQKIKHIDPNSVVSVLSAFPLFICDYYGCSRIQNFLSQ